MPGPTEILTDDVKELRKDFSSVEKEVAVLGDRIKGILRSISILGVLALSGLCSSIWWGATLTADVRNLGTRIEKLDSATEAHFSKVEQRFDRVEASIAKLLEQAKSR